MYTEARQLLTKLSMHAIISHRGDSYISMQEESLQTTPSFLMESGHIRERNINSVSRKTTQNHPKSIKRLRDLQEPRDIISVTFGLEEEENEDEEEEEENEVEDNHNEGVEEEDEKTEQRSDFDFPPMLNRVRLYASAAAAAANQDEKFQEEMALLHQEHTLISSRTQPNQSPSQTLTQLNNRMIGSSIVPLSAGTSSNRKPSSQFLDRGVSQESTTNEGRTGRFSTSETLISLNLKQSEKTQQQQKAFPVSMKVIPSEEDECHRARRLSSSASSILLVIPDEPIKSELKLSCCTSARGRQQFKMAPAADIAKKLLALKQSKHLVREDIYFMPSLIRSFLEGSRDKTSQLYWQYFQKMYSSYSDTFKFPVGYLSQKQQQYQELSEQQQQLKYPLQPNSVYLPPLKDNKRKTIFFDLDETLIHCIETFQLPKGKETVGKTSSHSANQKNAFQMRNSDPCNETICNINFQDEKFKCLVSIRPNAKEVLTELAKDFELILLTAAKNVYADAVLEKLDPEGVLFSHRFYRECCTEIRSEKQKGYLKDLRIFQNRSLENIVLVDNTPISFSEQMNNGIPIIDYCNDNKSDQELSHLSVFLTTQILHAPDVRVPIMNKFHLARFKEHASIEQLQKYLYSQFSHLL